MAYGRGRKRGVVLLFGLMFTTGLLLLTTVSMTRSLADLHATTTSVLLMQAAHAAEAGLDDGLKQLFDDVTDGRWDSFEKLGNPYIPQQSYCINGNTFGPCVAVKSSGAYALTVDPISGAMFNTPVKSGDVFKLIVSGYATDPTTGAVRPETQHQIHYWLVAGGYWRYAYYDSGNSIPTTTENIFGSGWTDSYDAAVGEYAAVVAGQQNVTNFGHVADVTTDVSQLGNAPLMQIGTNPTESSNGAAFRVNGSAYLHHQHTTSLGELIRTAKPKPPLNKFGGQITGGRSAITASNLFPTPALPVDDPQQCSVGEVIDGTMVVDVDAGEMGQITFLNPDGTVNNAQTNAARALVTTGPKTLTFPFTQVQFCVAKMQFKGGVTVDFAGPGNWLRTYDLQVHEGAQLLPNEDTTIMGEKTHRPINLAIVVDKDETFGKYGDGAISIQHGARVDGVIYATRVTNVHVGDQPSGTITELRGALISDGGVFGSLVGSAHLAFDQNLTLWVHQLVKIAHTSGD